MNKKICFEALESIFEVGFEFFGVFRLGLAETEESLRSSEMVWLFDVLAVEAMIGKVRGEKKKKKKPRGVHEGEAGGLAGNEEGPHSSEMVWLFDGLAVEAMIGEVRGEKKKNKKKKKKERKKEGHA